MPYIFRTRESNAHQPSAFGANRFTASRGSRDLANYVDEMCDRVDAVDPDIQALLPEPGRRERLRAEAAGLERRYPQPASRPPLYGALVAVKDIFHVDGFVTRAGSNLPPELFAGAEASCVTTLREAGALILGKSVTTEFAYFEPGPTRNPARLGSHARRLQQRLGRRSGGGSLPVGRGHADHRIGDPAGGLLRRGGLQAEPGPHREQGRGLFFSKHRPGGLVYARCRRHAGGCRRALPRLADAVGASRSAGSRRAGRGVSTAG